MDEVVSVFSGYGLQGVVIGALFWVLSMHMKQGSQERKEWRETFVSMSKMADDRQKETNEIIRNLTGVIERK